MNIANFINKNGEKKQIFASDPNCTKYKNKLICPCCGVKVDWINGLMQVKHFRHHHGTTAIECENYCNSLASLSAYSHTYETEGLSLYLYKEFDQYFLAIGLLGLDETTINDAVSIDLKVEIDRGKDSIIKKISANNFAPKEISFVKLNDIKEEYKLKFNQENIPREINKKWKKSINGISNSNAVFNYGNYLAKKVSSTNGVCINQEYILFTADNIHSNSISGVVFENIQEYRFDRKKTVMLYKFVIKEKTDAAISFFEQFDLHIKNVVPEIIPIWPPCTKREHELIYKKEAKKYFIIKNDVGLGSDLYSFDPIIKTKNQIVQYNRILAKTNYSGNETIILKNRENHILNDLLISSLNRDFINNIADIEEKNNIVNIKNHTKIFINRFKNNILLDSKIYKNQSDIEIGIKKNEQLIILYGLDVFWTVEYQSLLKSEIDIEKFDRKLLLKIMNCKGRYINMPASFKWLVLIYKRYPNSYLTLIKHLQKRKVTLELYNLLRNSK